MTHSCFTRVWSADRPGTLHPERSHPLVTPPALTGVCFSGGSTRAYAATLGHLRGLTETGLISRVGYISAVSGGAWAATPYTYYAGAAGSDAELLGPYQAPERLTVGALEALESHALGYAATRNFGRALAAAQGARGGTPDRVWSYAVGQMFLEPFGLTGRGHPGGFTLNDETAGEIYQRNPHLREATLRTTWSRSYRPYLLVHATLNWPADEPDAWPSQRVGFEYAPLGIGAAPALTLRWGTARVRVGGGFVEPFAFGGGPPRHDDPGAIVDVGPPDRILTLDDMVGASSAFSAPDRDPRSYPQADCWPVSRGDPESSPTSRQVFSDGGDLENYGLIALLRRGVRGVVVFINSLWPLTLDYDPTSWPEDLDVETPSRRRLDPCLAPLFGAPSSRFPHNRVFSEADYPGLVTGLQEAKRRGDTVMTVTTHTVQSNEWWALEGGHEVKVGWVYNDSVDRWSHRLPPAVQALVREGQGDDPTGPYARFPHYLTRGQNPGALIRLTAPQVNLLAQLSSWNVVTNRDALRRVLE